MRSGIRVQGGGQHGGGGQHEGGGQHGGGGQHRGGGVQFIYNNYAMFTSFCSTEAEYYRWDKYNQYEHR
jgi:hypothetical protein